MLIGELCADELEVCVLKPEPEDSGEPPSPDDFLEFPEDEETPQEVDHDDTKDEL